MVVCKTLNYRLFGTDGDTSDFTSAQEAHNALVLSHERIYMRGKREIYVVDNLFSLILNYCYRKKNKTI
jgi:hypothetical protein